MSTPPCVLLVDDEAFVRDSLSEILVGEGFRTLTADGVPAALRLLATEAVQAVVTDLKMPSGDGVSLVAEARQQGVSVPIVVMTGMGTVADAVAAMRAGAYDFLQKPVDPDQLTLLLRRAVEHHGLQKEVRNLRTALDRRSEERLLAGDSESTRRIRSLIEQVAPTDATVLVSGESGVGKEIVAEEIHRRSRRAGKPLVRVNCAAIPDQLFESEFFGHRRGAFTGAVADRTGRFAEAEGGTLVLDEIGTLKAEMQAKLLRVLEGGEFQCIGEARTRVADVRVIAVSNEDLAARVKEGAFRADLFYRLAIFPIEVPPLRKRKEDLAGIARALLARLRGRRADAPEAADDLDPAALAVLASYDWPGNVRELRNVLERALIVSGGRNPGAALFRLILESSLSAPSPATLSDAPSLGGADEFTLRPNLDAAEKSLVLKALSKAGGVKKDASALLGIDPRNLGYYLRKHGIET
ncbi:MAG TPA: sigma-54 dependent transcriptional regulator [Planctomycetota bacterium]|nr:sigma-54 dependent transcriptional regulator [Planctomycetota bacterium]